MTLKLRITTFTFTVSAPVSLCSVLGVDIVSRMLHHPAPFLTRPFETRSNRNNRAYADHISELRRILFWNEPISTTSCVAATNGSRFSSLSTLQLYKIDQNKPI
jgi:hypothetical protein